jgi:hypothetical protein
MFDDVSLELGPYFEFSFVTLIAGAYSMLSCLTGRISELFWTSGFMSFQDMRLNAEGSRGEKSTQFKVVMNRAP